MSEASVRFSKTHNKAIIQCPSCSTKFALDRGLFAEQDTPRFHCSRCDHVFTLDKTHFVQETPKPLTVAPTSVVEREPVITQAQSAPIVSQSNGLLDTELHIDEPRIDGPQFAELQQTELISNPNISFPRSQALRVPKSVDLDAPRLAPHEVLHSELHSEAESGLQTAFDFTKTATKAPAATAESLELPRFSSSIAERYNPPIAQTTQTTPEPQPSFSKTRSAGIGAWINQHPLGILVAPIAFILAMLSLFTIFSRQFPIEASYLISSLSPSAPQVAPSGLSVDDTSFRRVILESGESVSLISGRILNNTEQRFTEVQLEGQAFDGSGQLVSSALSTAAAALARTRIKSLTPEMIEAMQSERKAFSLNPGEEQSFTIALTDSDLPNAAYYAARIFSVKGENS